MNRKTRFNENQLALPFRERGSISLSYEGRERAFWLLAGVSIFSLFVYFYAVNAIARNTALRENLEAHLADSGSRIGSLEFSYISLKNGVTSDIALARGFTEAKAPLYVTRTQAASLTLNR